MFLLVTYFDKWDVSHHYSIIDYWKCYYLGFARKSSLHPWLWISIWLFWGFGIYHWNIYNQQLWISCHSPNWTDTYWQNPNYMQGSSNFCRESLWITQIIWFSWSTFFYFHPLCHPHCRYHNLVKACVSIQNLHQLLYYGLFVDAMSCWWIGQVSLGRGNCW